jgi:hypothetical protein
MSVTLSDIRPPGGPSNSQKLDYQYIQKVLGINKKTTNIFILETAVGHEKDVQNIDVHKDI